MKMIGHDHFICHSYCHFSVLSHLTYDEICTEMRERYDGYHFTHDSIGILLFFPNLDDPS